LVIATAEFHGDHSRTKTKSPQTNGICERFHCTVLDEFYRVAFRKKIYRTIDELQADRRRAGNRPRSDDRRCFGECRRGTRQGADLMLASLPPHDQADIGRAAVPSVIAARGEN
jgi:hypothetical protein